MSTNYYFVNKDDIEKSKEIKKKVAHYFGELEENLIELGFDEDYVKGKLLYSNEEFNFPIKEIHIGKRSMGWKPLFQTQEEFKSVIEIKDWYDNNKNEWVIMNEYYDELSWDDLVNELINWNNNEGKSHIENINYCNPSYSRQYKDVDGYEWYDGEFC